MMREISHKNGFYIGMNFDIDKAKSVDILDICKKVIEYDNGYYETDKIENIDSIQALDFICQVMEYSKAVNFYITGFKCLENLSCIEDLQLLLEQIPDINDKISNDIYDFEISFYEQATQKKLVFTDTDGYITVSCCDISKSHYYDESYSISKYDLQENLSEFKNRFIELATIMCPCLAKIIS
jgi:hypothetical protein